MIERTGSYFTNELASPKRPESLSVEEIQRIDLRIQGLLVSGVDLASVARQIGAGRFVYEDKGKTGLQTTRFDVAEYKASLSMQGSVPVWLPATVIRTEVEILPATGDLPDSGIEKFVPAQLVPKRKLFGELVSQLDSSYVLVSFVGKGSARVSPDRYSLFYLPTYKAAVMLSGSSSDSTYVLGGVSTLEQAMEYQRYDKAVLQRLLPNNVTAVENSLSGKLLSGDGTADAVRRLWDDWGQDWQLRLKEAICQEFPPLVSDIVPVFQESGTQSGYSTNALAKELGVAFEVVDSRVRALEAQGKRVGAFEQTDRGALFILSRQAVEHIREAVVLPERLRNWVPEVELRNELEVSQKVLLDYLDGLASSLDAPAYEMRIDPIFSKLRTVFIDPKIVPVVREHFQKPGPGFRVLGQVLDEIGVDTKVFRRIMASHLKDETYVAERVFRRGLSVFVSEVCVNEFKKHLAESRTSAPNGYMGLDEILATYFLPRQTLFTYLKTLHGIEDISKILPRFFDPDANQSMYYASPDTVREVEARFGGRRLLPESAQGEHTVYSLSKELGIDGKVITKKLAEMEGVGMAPVMRKRTGKKGADDYITPEAVAQVKRFVQESTESEETSIWPTLATVSDKFGVSEKALRVYLEARGRTGVDCYRKTFGRKSYDEPTEVVNPEYFTAIQEAFPSPPADFVLVSSLREVYRVHDRDIFKVMADVRYDPLYFGQYLFRGDLHWFISPLGEREYAARRQNIRR